MMVAIPTTLELIRQKLNTQTTVPGNEDWVILTNIVDHEGHVSEQAKNKVVMSLANIRYETVISDYNRAIPDNNIHFIAPPLYIDLYVLFFANFSDRNYLQGLALISETISFFQKNPWFTDKTLPGLDPAIDKLSFEMVNLDLADLNYVMDMMGAKYLPSVYYKVRMFTFSSDVLPGESAV